MHDPMAVAHEINYPWKNSRGYRDTFITLWHKDPCKDGSDNSCDWHGHKRKLNPQETALLKAIYDMEPILDNRPFYPDHPAHLRFQKVQAAKWEWLKRRGFRIHPRWHVWHWRVQVHPLQMVWQWIFERCVICKGRFKFGESKIGNWDGDKVWHHRCDHVNYVKPKPELSVVEAHRD